MRPSVFCECATQRQPSVPISLHFGDWEKTSYKEDIKFPFGAVVIVASPEAPSGEGSKGVTGIVVDKDSSVRGGLKVCLPSSGSLLIRKAAKQGAVTSDFVKLMNERAAASRQRDERDRVVKINGEVVSPQPLVGYDSTWDDFFPFGCSTVLSTSSSGHSKVLFASSGCSELANGPFSSS
jgi:hypothetical protein